MDKTTWSTPELDVFLRLVNCNHTVYSWLYDGHGVLIETDCPTLELHLLFHHSGCLEYAMKQSSQHHVPMILGARLGLMWGAVLDDNGGHGLIRVLGPCLNSVVSIKAVEDASKEMVPDMGWRKNFRTIFEKLPVIPVLVFQEYLLMLNYCVHGEKLRISDIHMQNDSEASNGTTHPLQDRQQTYMAEKALLHYVREGDLNYKDALSLAGSLSMGIRVTTSTPINQAIISVAAFVTLCVRASIEGGLSPDTAYSVGDSYIQRLMDCKTITDAGAISYMMYDDFIHRVHKNKDGVTQSRQIRDCAEYIERHLEEDLSIRTLALRFGYSDYYLSRKFKSEMNMSVNHYINLVRIEKAKLLLETTEQSVTEIAESLNFCSYAYFSSVFKKFTGQSPSQYREDAQP